MTDTPAISDRNLEATTNISLKREPACFAFLSARSVSPPMPIDSINLDLPTMWAGVIAAAGLVALDSMIDRLADDHRRARRLAEAVAERWPGAVAPDAVYTNMVCAIAERLPRDLLDRLDAEGIRAGTIDTRTVRFATHKDVDDADIERVLKTFERITRD